MASSEMCCASVRASQMPFPVHFGHSLRIPSGRGSRWAPWRWRVLWRRGRNHRRIKNFCTMSPGQEDTVGANLIVAPLPSYIRLALAGTASRCEDRCLTRAPSSS